jgi:hypothetical protein
MAPAASPPATEQPTPAPVVPVQAEQAPAQPDKAGKKDGSQGQGSSHDNGQAQGHGQGKHESGGAPPATPPVDPQQVPVPAESVSPTASGVPTDRSAQDQNGHGDAHGAPQSGGPGNG